MSSPPAVDAISSAAAAAVDAVATAIATDAIDAGLRTAAAVTTPEPAATTTEKLYVLHLSQKNDDVMLTNKIPDRKVDFTHRGEHFLYCLLFCNSDNQVVMSLFGNFKQKIKSSRARNEDHINDFNDRMQDDFSLRSLTTWCRLQLRSTNMKVGACHGDTTSMLGS